MTKQRCTEQNPKCEKFCKTSNLLHSADKLQQGKRTEREETID